MLLRFDVEVRGRVHNRVMVDEFHAFSLIDMHGHCILAYFTLLCSVVQAVLLGLSLRQLVKKIRVVQVTVLESVEFGRVLACTGILIDEASIVLCDVGSVTTHIEGRFSFLGLLKDCFAIYLLFLVWMNWDICSVVSWAEGGGSVRVFE
jgi:hypothetical protein